MANKPIDQPVNRERNYTEDETKRHPKEGLEEGFGGSDAEGRLDEDVLDQDDITEKEDMVDDDEFVKGRDKAI